MMHEVFPVVAGMLLGFVALRIDSTQLRVFVLATMSILLGVVATIISGEALISWAFVLIDIPLVLASAVGVIVATYAWQHRGAAQLRS
jgi:hypothetical protein